MIDSHALGIGHSSSFWTDSSAQDNAVRPVGCDYSF